MFILYIYCIQVCTCLFNFVLLISGVICYELYGIGNSHIAGQPCGKQLAYLELFVGNAEALLWITTCQHFGDGLPRSIQPGH